MNDELEDILMAMDIPGDIGPQQNDNWSDVDEEMEHIMNVMTIPYDADPTYHSNPLNVSQELSRFSFTIFIAIMERFAFFQAFFITLKREIVM